MSNTSNIVRTEFAAAIQQIANERKIEVESIHEAIRQALVSAYRKEMGDLSEDMHYYTNLDVDTGESRIMQAPATAFDEETAVYECRRNPISALRTGSHPVAAQRQRI